MTGDAPSGTSDAGPAPRHVRQPGTPAAERCTAVPVTCLPIEATLPAGTRLLDALHALLGDRFDSACLTLSGGGLHPFAYVMPARSPDADHAAFYSSTFRPSGGETRFELGTVTVGVRDGQPFFHCHAVWTEPDGHRGCGHVLPDETVVASPIRVEGVGIAGARFEVHPDAETGYSLFTPRATGRPPIPDGRAGVALRLAPNQDLVTALEQAGARAGFSRAAVAGGVGSTIEARFAAGPPINGYATELLVRRGDIGCAPSGAPTVFDIVIVDLEGTIGDGELLRGDNPVLITFEGVLLAA